MSLADTTAHHMTVKQSLQATQPHSHTTSSHRAGGAENIPAELTSSGLFVTSSAITTETTTRTPKGPKERKVRSVQYKYKTSHTKKVSVSDSLFTPLLSFCFAKIELTKPNKSVKSDLGTAFEPF